MKSPFTIGPTITKPEEFIGRKAEVNHIITRLRTMQSCSVIGARRIGKSSLLHYNFACASLLHLLTSLRR
jgi:hypothetical protein